MTQDDRTSGIPARLRGRVRAGIEKAVRALVACQLPNGSWPGDNHGGPIPTAVALITERYLDTLSQHDAREGTRWLLSQQLEDGSWPGYPDADSGMLSATAACYAGLLAAGRSPNEAPLERARSYIDAHGGLRAADIQTQIYMVLQGLLEPSVLPRPSFVQRLIPGLQRVLATRFGVQILSMANLYPVIAAGLWHGGPLPRPRWRPLRCLALTLFERYLTERQNPKGNWAGIMLATTLGILALHFLGVPKHDPRLAKALRYLNHWKIYGADGLEVMPYVSEVWNTALSTRALIVCGVPVDHPVIRRGVRYLLAHQGTLDEPADWQNPACGAPRSGGWAYEDGNPLCADCDTTGAVLWTLGLLQEEGSVDDHGEASAKGLAWLLGMQNRDGGWGAFTHGHETKPPGPLFTAPPEVGGHDPLALLELFIEAPPEFADPATSGLTARVLSGLAHRGYTKRDPEVAHAIRFIKYQTAKHGVWWGRWAVNYLQSTGHILVGLADVGEDMQAPYVRRAVDWIVSKQNSDGGWGEAISSYRHPELAGEGPSMATVTGVVLSGLIAAGEGESEAVVRGLRYLLATQGASGLWQDSQAAFVMIPPDSFYTNHIYTQCTVLDALGLWRQRHTDGHQLRLRDVP